MISLDTLSPGEAAALLAQLAGRAGLAAPAGPAGEITRLCGYLPLAIGMLARQLRHHPARTGAELAAGLAAARDRLAVMRTENLSVAAAFDLSYQELTGAQQRLFAPARPIPGPDIDAYAAAALDDTSVATARSQLDELYDHHLITEPAPGRYLLHDLLREYARALAGRRQRGWPRRGRSAGQLLRARGRGRQHGTSPPGPRPAAGCRRPARQAAPRSWPAPRQQPAGWTPSGPICSGRRLRRRPGHAAARRRDRRRDGRLPARPRPLGPGRGPVPDRPGRGPPGRGPVRPGRACSTSSACSSS